MITGPLSIFHDAILVNEDIEPEEVYWYLPAFNSQISRLHYQDSLADRKERKMHNVRVSGPWSPLGQRIARDRHRRVLKDEAILSRTFARCTPDVGHMVCIVVSFHAVSEDTFPNSMFQMLN